MKNWQTKGIHRGVGVALVSLLLLSASGCALFNDTYHDEQMDFGAIQTVAVMPLENVSQSREAALRIRDVLVTKLLATYAFYVLPSGEVNRGITEARVSRPTAPTAEEVVRLCKELKADAVITGTVREYGQARSGTTSANVISMSLQMMEAGTGKMVWNASTTKGGVDAIDRLFGGGGQPMNDVTAEAIDDLIGQLFQ